MNSPHHPIATSRREFLITSAAALSATTFGRIAQGAEKTESGLLPRSIHPYPNKVTWGAGTLSLSKRATLTVGRDCDAGVVEMMKDLWKRFTFGAVELAVTRDAALQAGEFGLAGGKPPQREANATYALTVNASGIAASATDAAGVRHAWFTFLQLLDADDAPGGGLSFAVPHVEIQDWPVMKFRGLHLCIFRETPPHMIERAIRLAAFFKFTHVVLEFWGM
ncbi:MAG: hypothetical protein FJ388_26800, partial [Verrucomicrobia bacterium]|nr:hypothetical protein [Verrucomicrobiota bacterium]